MQPLIGGTGFTSLGLLWDSDPVDQQGAPGDPFSGHLAESTDGGHLEQALYPAQGLHRLRVLKLPSLPVG